MIKRFIAYYKPHRVLFIIDMLCSVIIALCDLIYPIIAKNIINVYVPARALNAIFVCSAFADFHLSAEICTELLCMLLGARGRRSDAGRHAAGLVCTFGKVTIFFF